MCRFTDHALVSAKRKASCFEDFDEFEPVAESEEGGSEPDSVTKQALPHGVLNHAGSLVSLEFARLWSIDSNSADFLGLGQVLGAPAPPAEDRCKRESGGSAGNTTACPPRNLSATSLFSSSQQPVAPQPAFSPATAAAAAVADMSLESIALLEQPCANGGQFTQALLMPEGCDMWDFTPQECPEQDSMELLQEFGAASPLAGVHPFPALQPQQYQALAAPQLQQPSQLFEQQQQDDEQQQQQYLQQYQLLQQQATPAAPAAVAVFTPAFSVPAVAVLPVPAVTTPPTCTPATAIGGTGDFELCEKFYGSVMRLKDYAASVGIERLNPTGADAAEGVLPGLLEHVRTVSKVCIDLFKPECPAVLSGLVKSTAALQPEMAAQRWRHIITHVRMTEQQVAAVQVARERHLASLSALYQERADLALVVQELVASTGAPGYSPAPCGGGGVDLSRQGFLYCAHASQGLQRATEGLQAVLVRERDLVMKLYLELVYFVLTPVQAATYIMEAFPHHIDVLAMANACCLAAP